MAYKNPLIRVDLGVREVAQPCSKHQKAGVQDDCDACREMPPGEAKVPELEGYWVEIRNPKVLPFGLKRQLFAAAAPVLPDDSAEQQQRKAELAEERLVRIVKGLITAWNLTPVDNPDGEVLPVPSEEDAAFDAVPDIVVPVIAAIGRYEREQSLPKASATS